MFDCVCLQRIKPDIAQEKQIKQIFLFFFFSFTGGTIWVMWDKTGIRDIDCWLNISRGVSCP